MLNKPIVTNTAELDIEFSAGTMINYQTWTTVLDCDLRIQIILDQQVILDQALTTELTRFHYNFVDTVDTQKHKLQICLRGVPAEQVENSNVMLKIHNLWIERLNMHLAMQDLGEYCHQTGEVHVPSEYMGCNGYWSLEFTTPIYAWLFDKELKPDYYYNP